MPSPRKKRRDEEATELARLDGLLADRSAVSGDSIPEDVRERVWSRPRWRRPEGRETDPGLTTMLQLYLDENYSSDATWRHRLVEVLLEQADQGNLRAIQEIWIRLEGKPGAPDGENAEAPNIGPELTAKILEAGCTDDEDPPLD